MRAWTLSLMATLSLSDVTLAQTLVPDPLLQGAWWLKRLQVQESWLYGTGKGVVVAICDAGFYLNTEDLDANVDHSRAMDFSDLDHPQRVDDGPYAFHGTASATLVAGVRDGLGTQGIAFNAAIVPLQSYNYDASIDDLSRPLAIRDCIAYAASQEDVDIILVQSSSGYGTIEAYGPIRENIRNAIESGKAVIIPAGEMGIELTEEHHDDTGSIIVGALMREGQMAHYSNFGSRVTVSGFGEKVETVVGRRGQIDTFRGTTSAAAQVAGTVALMLSANPNLSPAAVRKILERTGITTDLNVMVGGQIDAHAAVRQAALSVITGLEPRI